MSKRVTIMIDDNQDKRIRLLQAKELTKTLKSCSYSKMLGIVLEKGLK